MCGMLNNDCVIFFYTPYSFYSSIILEYEEGMLYTLEIQAMLSTFPYLCTLHMTLLAPSILLFYFFAFLYHWIHQIDLFPVVQNHNDHLLKNKKGITFAIKVT